MIIIYLQTKICEKYSNIPPDSSPFSVVCSLPATPPTSKEMQKCKNTIFPEKIHLFRQKYNLYLKTSTNVAKFLG